MLPKIDLLAYDTHLITNVYFETLVRYSFYFAADPEFFGFMVARAFSPQAILSRQKAISSHVSYQFLRLVEIMQAKSALVQHCDDICQRCI